MNKLPKSWWLRSPYTGWDGGAGFISSSGDVISSDNFSDVSYYSYGRIIAELRRTRMIYTMHVLCGRLVLSSTAITVSEIPTEYFCSLSGHKPLSNWYSLGNISWKCR